MFFVGLRSFLKKLNFGSQKPWVYGNITKELKAFTYQLLFTLKFWQNLHLIKKRFVFHLPYI